MRLPHLSRGQLLLYTGLALLLLVIGGRLLLSGEPSDPAPAPASAGPALTLEEEPGEGPDGEASDVVVHVAGAVERAGLYSVERGSRVADALEAAGGATRTAALELVNLAAPVADGQQIVVPARGAGERSAGRSPGQAETPGPVPLNSATVADLEALPGIGPVTARKIIDYRDEHGAFRSVDQLDAIPGIGPSRLEELRDLLAV